MGLLSVVSLFLFIGAFSIASAKVSVIAPSDTKSGFRVSGYDLSLSDASVTKQLKAAVDAKKDFSVYAVSLRFPATIDVSGVPKFRVYAHTCTALDSNGKVTITSRGADGKNAPNNKPPPAARGERGKPGETGGNAGVGGTVLMYCGNWTTTTSLTVDVRGGKGGKGGPAGDGGAGKKGTKSSNGSCNGGFFKCIGNHGKQGALSGHGSRGGEAGLGGFGGNGGSVLLVNSSLLTTNFILAGGDGGDRGIPGKGGKAGPKFPPFIKVTVCKCKNIFCLKCIMTTATFRRAPVFDGPPGRRGDSNARSKAGKVGNSFIFAKSAELSKEFVPEKNILVWLRLLRRYVSDRLLSVEGLNPDSPKTQEVINSGLKVLDTVRDGADLLPTKLTTAQKQATDVLATRLKTGSGYFGRAVLQRISPNDIKKQLNIEYEYATQVSDTVDRAEKEQNLLSVITQATQIAIPNKNFDQLERNLRQRRVLMVSAINRIESEIESALGDAQIRILDAQNEAIRKKIDGQVENILSFVWAGAGLGGALADKDPFAGVQSAVRLTQAVKNIVKSVEEFNCSIDDLVALMESGADLDLRKGFPSDNDFKQDLSKLNNIELVGAVRKAELESKAAELTSQLACVFSTDGWATLPAVRAAFDRIFINAGARADLVDTILDIDAELVALGVERAGVEEQEAELVALAGSSQGALARAPTIDALTAKYESARESVLKGLASLASSFKLVSLVEFNDIISDFARFRLDSNGVVSVALEHIELVGTRAKLLRAFRDRAECLSELPDQRFFFWDMPINNTVQGGVVEPLKSGPDNQFAFQLSWYSDCGMYGRTEPPIRGLPSEKLQFCAPNQVVFNSRMLSMGVELVGGDKSLLPAGRTAVSAFMHQVGRQTFRQTQRDILSLNTAALLVPLQDSPLADSAVLKMRSFCSPTTNVDTFVDKPLSCPSPFSTYLLRLGRASDANLDKFLATVTHVRVHLQVSSSSSLCLAKNRARVANILKAKEPQF